MDQLAEKLRELSQPGFLSLIGGIANYFYYNEKHQRAFNIASFFVNAFLAFFVGMVASDWVPMNEFRDGLIMMCGFCCYPILGIFESRVIGFFKKIIK